MSEEQYAAIFIMTYLVAHWALAWLVSKSTTAVGVDWITPKALVLNRVPARLLIAAVVTGCAYLWQF